MDKLCICRYLLDKLIWQKGKAQHVREYKFYLNIQYYGWKIKQTFTTILFCLFLILLFSVIFESSFCLSIFTRFCPKHAQGPCVFMHHLKAKILI